MVLYKYSEDITNSSLPLSNNLFSMLQRDILMGKLKEGEKLTEQRLCEEYSVSRTPVREALRQLEINGLVENIPNRGSFVVGMSEQDIKDIFDLRMVNEVQAVRWAIRRITEEEMTALEETFEFMEFYTMKNDIKKMTNINKGFHQIISTACHNRMLEHMISSYQEYTRYVGEERKKSDDYLQILLEEHRKIFRAFTEKDEDAGAQAMKEHIENSKRRQCGE